MIPFDDYTSVAYLLQSCLFFQQASVVQISAICDYSAEHTNKLAQGHTQCCLNTSCLPNLFFFPQVFYITHSSNSSEQTSRSIAHTGKNQVCPLCNCQLVPRAPYATVTYHAIIPHLYAIAKYNAFQSMFPPIFIPTNYNLHLYLIPPK